MRPVQPEQLTINLDDYPAALSRGRSDDLADRHSKCIDFEIMHAPPLFGSRRTWSGISDMPSQASHVEDPLYCLDETDTPCWWLASGRADKEMPDTNETVVVGEPLPQKRRLHCITAPILDEGHQLWAPLADDFLLQTPRVPLHDSDGDTDSHAETDSTTSFEYEGEEIYNPNKDDKFEDYLLLHCGIRAADLKVNALARIRDISQLLCDLEQGNIVRLVHGHAEADASSAARDVASIFGFTKMFVDEVAAFNERVTSMVVADPRRCWHANGRHHLKQPTNTVYELLRQLGIHPVKGTRGDAYAQQGDAPGTGTRASRDFMLYSEYMFDMARLKRNCSRLKIGVIGNRRT